MRRPKPAKLARCPRLREVVESKLELRWSPQQIAAWLRIGYPGNPEMRVSHETIYLSLFVQPEGALRKELARYLRRGRARRRPRGLSVMNGQGQLRGDRPHLPAARRSQRPGGARALGRGPGVRHEIQHRRHPGGAHEPLGDARRPARWPHR